MIPVMLLLMADTTAAPATTPAPVAEKLICKREPVTGSLARFRKICKTEAQWLNAQNHAVTESQAMQDRGLINSEAPR